MKKVPLLLSLSAIVMTFGLKVLGIPDGQDDIGTAIQGAWEHHGLYYMFEDSVMTAVKMTGETKGYKTFHYTVHSMGNLRLIRYGKDLKKTRDNRLLLVDDVTDSTAVIAYSTVFVRSDSGNGFNGTWKHTRDLKSIVISVGNGTFDYSELTIDESTGELVVTSERHGVCQGGKGKNMGRFRIRFDDGTQVTVVPVIFGDIMYFFDLSPRKSMFFKTDSAPTFREYKKAIPNS